MSLGAPVIAAASGIHVLAFTHSRTAGRFVSSFLALSRVPVSVQSIDRSTVCGLRRSVVGPRNIALIEIGSDMIESRALGATLKNLFPLLPQLGLLQCTEILDLWHMEWLLSGELGGLVDMETTPDELLATFNAVLTGTLVLQLRARPQHTRQIWPVGRSTAALGLGPRLTVDDEVLARLAADGRSEADLGREMHLSVHTIHRKLERLRALLGLRNRIELAAWCGAQGLYRPVPLPVADRERRALDGEGFGEVLEQVLEQTPY